MAGGQCKIAGSEQEISLKESPTQIDVNSRLHTVVIPAVAGAVLICLTVWAWSIVRDTEYRLLATRFDERAIQFESALEARYKVYEQSLRAGVALFATTNKVSREQWKIFVERMKVEENYPGILGIGFSEYIKPEDLDAHINQIQKSGFPDYRVWPEGSRSSYTAIVYLEPFNAQNMRAFGYDMASNAVRQKAMALARDNDSLAISGKITLVQETDEDVQSGFLVYLPVYRNAKVSSTVGDRRDSLIGWVYSPYRMNDLIHSTLNSIPDTLEWNTGDLKKILVNIYDGQGATSKSLMYRGIERSDPPLFSKTIVMNPGGHHWRLEFASSLAFEENLDRSVSNYTLTVGILISILGSFLFRQQGNTRNKAVALAQNMMQNLNESELRLRKSEKEFRDLFEHSPVGLSSEDFSGVKTELDRLKADGVDDFGNYFKNNPDDLRRIIDLIRIIDLNEAQLRIYGAESRASFIEWDQQVPHQQVGNVLDYYTELFCSLWETGSYTGQMEDVRLDGTAIELSCNVRILEQETGTWSHAALSVEDITERKNIERKVADSEKRFRKAFESAGHGVAMVDLNGSWLDVNTRICDMFGYSKEEMIQTNFQNITHPDDLEEDLSLLKQVLAGEIESYQIEKRYFRKDGTTMPAMLSVGLVVDENDKPVHFVSQITDLSAAKIAEEKFLQAQKMEAVGSLTGGIAHDFNNILGVILGNLQLLERRVGSDPKLLKFAGTAVEATRRGAELTKQLLAFSRRQELDPKVLNANDMVRNMDNLLRRTLGDDVDIQTGLADNLYPVKADPAQLESAVLNLAINARDAMPEGGKLLIETSNEILDADYAETHALAQTGPHVCISVTDTGSGIPSDMMEHIFEPFFTTKDVGKGTGLGLSMVHGFVVQSGGHINVYSEIGHGTRFRLYLPKSDTDVIETQTDIIETDVPTGSGIILLVEDETRVRETTALLLEDLGYTVISSENGPEALDCFNKIPNICLLFTDMVMPGGMNGHQLADSIRVMEPEIPVLLTSGYPRDAFVNGRRFPLLQKPYTNSQLGYAIHAALNAPSELS